MKVYLVFNEYYDYNEYSGGSMLVGVYSSMESAISARNDFVAEEMNCPAKQSIDAENNPVITKFFNGKMCEEITFTIEEWLVQ